MAKTVIDLKNPNNKYFVDEQGKRIAERPTLGSYKCTIILCMLDLARRESFSRMLQDQLSQFQDKGERVDEIHVLSPAALPRLLEKQPTKSLENLIVVFSGKERESDRDVLPALQGIENRYAAVATALLSNQPFSRLVYMESNIEASIIDSAGQGMLFYTAVLPVIKDVYRKIKAPLRSNDSRAQAMLDSYDPI